MARPAKNEHVLDKPEMEELLNSDVEIKYGDDKKIKDSRKIPGRIAIMKDATKSIMAKRMLEAKEKGEKLTYTELGKQFGLSHTAVSNRLSDIRKQWRETAIRDWDSLVQHELAVLNALEEEAWAEWHRSKLDSETVSEETNQDGEYKTRVVLKGQTGNARYLDTIIRCINKRSELLGLDKPKQIEVRGYEDKLIDYLKSGRVSYEEVVAIVGSQMAKKFLKKANLVIDNE